MKNTKRQIGAFIVFIFLGSSLLAQKESFNQRSQIGIAIGGMNYGGFMTKSPLTTKQAKFSAEIMYRYDVSNHFSVRGTFMVGALGKDNGNVDTLINGAHRYGSFHTGIVEGDILPEYNFLDLNKHRWTPYVYGGPGYYVLVTYKKDGKTYNKPDFEGFNLRAGAGIKYQINTSFQLFAEADTREFSKSIDFYNSQNSRSRYYSLMIGVTYRLEPRRLKELW
ncbi:DUF6089 family protein [Arachidicoccus sp.]|uniref:DUF6089 family protein n=1 Tax=Arachidicoccus sp. TaxID=1872624 RepID=UPI003D251CB8